ncbi:MAG TPA: hypothetical protein VES95_10980 [Dermatophilaceae bacterium]|nr:hypothetical protein [Dermatophilaceae bacterium]
MARGLARPAARPLSVIAALPVAAAVVGALLTAPTAAAAAPAAPAGSTAYQLGGSYEPRAAPQRILDTRASGGALGSGQTRVVDPSPSGAVPATGVSAVVVNLTVTGPTASGYLTAWAGGTRPTASSINFARGWTRANLVTVPLDAGGNLRLFNSAGSTHVIVDVLGWYHATGSVPTADQLGAAYYPDVPERLYDSRQDVIVAPGEAFLIGIDFGDDAGADATDALALNLTAVTPQRGGYLTTWDGSGSAPTTSTLNYVQGRTVSNMAVVGTSLCDDGAGGAVTCFGVRNGSSGSMHVVVDYVGAYAASDGSGTRFRAVPPRRVLDSRNGTGTTVGPFTARQTRTVSVPGTVAGASTVALATNATLVAPSAGTYLTLWAGAGQARPATSSVNGDVAQTVASAALPVVAGTATGTTTFAVYNNAGSAHVLDDVVGTFDVEPSGERSARPASPTDPARPASPAGTADPAAERAAALSRFDPGAAVRLSPGAVRTSSRPGG